MMQAGAGAGVVVSGLVLAAGGARRMGEPKQLLPWRGRPLLQHVIDAVLASRLDELILLLGHRAAEIEAALSWPRDLRVRVVVHPDWSAGQSTSLALGLRHCAAESRAAAVLLGDQPGVDAALIDRVVAAFLAAERPAARPVYCTSEGVRRPGHPVVLARSLWSAASAIRGDEGARGLFVAHPEWLLEVPVTGEPPPDIDDPEDYQRLANAPN